jgi:ATP-dependent DNA helicase RecQ
VLKGNVAVSFREEIERPRKRAKRERASTGSSSASSPLLEALRKWRVETAREHGVPAYVVFHDSTLESLAALRPRSLDELKRISGIGAAKLERYGEALLAITGDTV